MFNFMQRNTAQALRYTALYSPYQLLNRLMDLSALPPHLKFQILSIVEKADDAPNEEKSSTADDVSEPAADTSDPPPAIIDIDSVDSGATDAGAKCFITGYRI